MGRRELTREDLDDILIGAALLGTGGGGEIGEGRELISAALEAGKTFTLIDPADVPDTALVCTPYMLGALSGSPPEADPALSRLPRTVRNPLLAAYDRFQAHLGQTFYGVVACELGGSNTAAAFYCAAMNGSVIVDADPSGRAVPEIQHTTYHLAGLPPGDLVLANGFGECFIYENVFDDPRAEQIARALSVASGNDIAAIDHALPMHMLREAMIPGTISLSLDLGRKARSAKANDADLAQIVAARCGGRVVFRGRVVTNDWRTEDGFTVGQIRIADENRATCIIRFKNENMVCWRDDAVIATIPDLICLIERQERVPVTNPNAKVGAPVDVVVLPAPQAFASPAGVALFGPSYAGLDCAYCPIRERL